MDRELRNMKFYENLFRLLIAVALVFRRFDVG
jgi:hypothetical protein